MSCDNTLRMLNDFLDKTLSKDEERKIESHLGECVSCRSEYQNLKNADNTLRQVICEMVADIDVPTGLSDRIEKIMAGGKRNSLWQRLPALLKTPAFAAALLITVLTAGFLTGNNFFNQAERQKVATSGNDTGTYNDSTVLPTADKDGTAADENMGSIKEIQASQADSAGSTDERMRQDTADTAKDPVTEESGNMAGNSSAQSPAPAAGAAPEALRKINPVEDQGTAFIMTAPDGSGDNMVLYDEGTMEDAARNTGFIPAKPEYLPQGAVLSNVSWLAGEISQNYRAGSNYFTVSQSRLNAADLVYAEMLAQVSNVNINGRQGLIEESRAEPGDNASSAVTTLQWQQGEWAFSISGDLPAEEIIKIASSIK